MPTTALITGLTGQDGSYLAEALLEKGYRVFGLVRRASSFNTGRIDHLLQAFGSDRFEYVRGDLTDASVVATGKSHSVREFTEEVFGHLGLDWRRHVTTDARFVRPLEVEYLQGDPRRAAKKLGWRARTSFRDLVHIMVDADLRRETILLEGTAKHRCAGVVL